MKTDDDAGGGGKNGDFWMTSKDIKVPDTRSKRPVGSYIRY